MAIYIQMHLCYTHKLLIRFIHIWFLVEVYHSWTVFLTFNQIFCVKSYVQQNLENLKPDSSSYSVLTDKI